jgi:hypothetical protein
MYLVKTIFGKHIAPLVFNTISNRVGQHTIHRSSYNAIVLGVTVRYTAGET